MSPSMNSTTKLTSLDKDLVKVVAITSLASVISISLLLLRVVYAVLRPLSQGYKGRKEFKEVLFFRTQLGSYIACLLVANLLEGAVGLVGFSWNAKGVIESGSLCNAQGSLITIGNFAGAYFTALTAIHTFRTLVQRKPNPTWICILAIALGWGGAITLGTAFTGISTTRHGPFYGSLGLWCAISSGYTVEQFVVYYLPIIISALIIAILYAVIYLCLRGTLVIGDGIKLNLSPDNVHMWASHLNGREEYRHFLGSIIKSLLWFPFAYIILFIPITIAGTLTISGKSDGLGGLAFAGACSSLTGLANVLILCNTMRILRPAMRPSSSGSMGTESFSTPGELKPSPVEAPAPTNFNMTAASPGGRSMASPGGRTIAHGRSFPRTPISRATSPARSDASGSRPVTPRIKRIPPPRRSQDLDRRSEHEPTPEMMQEWLRHSRSNSSIGSTAALLGNYGSHSRSNSRATLGHSRSLSNSSSDMHTLAGAGGLPIIPCNDLTRRLDSELAKFHLQGPSDSPRPSIIISRTNSPPVPTPSLKPAPRPSRESQVSREAVGFQMPPMPPIPPSPVHDHHMDPRTPGTGKSFATSVFSDTEEGEIQQIDSRGPVVRPALSAVARIPCVFPTDNNSELIHEHDPASDAKLIRIRQLSLISAAGLPMSPVEPEEPMPSDTKSIAPSQRSDATSRLSSDDMHSLHMEMRSRMETPTPAPGGLSTLAWASLVAHAAAQHPRDSWMSNNLEAERIEGDEEDEGQGGRGFVPPPRPRRLSDVPAALQPGTPTSSIGAGMYNTFIAPRTAPGDNMV